MNRAKKEVAIGLYKEKEVDKPEAKIKQTESNDAEVNNLVDDNKCTVHSENYNNLYCLKC